MRMLTRCLAVVLAVIPLSAAASVEGQFDKSLTVAGPVTVRVTSGSGSIIVRSGPDQSVRIVGRIRGADRWNTRADEVLRAVKAVEAAPPVHQDGPAIRIGEIDDKEIARLVSISYDVTVPKSTAVAAKAGSGAVTIEALAGPVSASTGSGAIKVGLIAADVEARSGSGSIEVAGASKRLSVSTGSGAIEVGRVSGDVRIESGSGSVDVTDVADGTVTVSTGSGRIAVAHVNGGLTAHSGSGSVEIGGTPKADWQVNTASGGIRLAIPAGTGFRVRANTNSGRITTDHPLTISSAGRRELIGTVGEGAVLVAASSSSGSIQIDKR
jgi:DUF4097 and DUF4098 domain-containing protein YvlB